ncbi:hypothetical protein [Maridesulfovibrio sp. FT414]|uniref:hypothetical protein n=1 Tax=Maridesulfovibrio sp. FT414 TaxID=2979469 RepID=UPI003D80424A
MNKKLLAAISFAAMTFGSASASLADVTVYHCQNGTGCIDERVNFGAVQVKCMDVNNDVLADWVCEYELEYSCRNTLTGEIRTGGFDPLETPLCDKLCGSCKEGWEQ